MSTSYLSRVLYITKYSFLPQVSLIDQDLTLMHQLLTLNERIEELKWHRKLSGYLPAFMTASASSSNNVDGDSNALSDWDVDSQTGDRQSATNHVVDETDGLFYSKYLSPSKLSLFRECIYNSAQDNLHEMTPSSTHDVRLRTNNLTQSRTSDLGSSGELVSSVPDFRKANNLYRLSKGDSCISSGCPSNSSSLKKSDVDDDVMEAMTSVGNRLSVTDGESDGDKIGQKLCHDSGIHEDHNLDHNLEMII